MALQDLAQNVRRYRMAKKLSQPALAKAAGISPAAIKNLERAVSEPRVRTVEAIADALDVPLRDLFLPVRKLQTVRFRSKQRMQNRENILADAARWLDEFNFLEDLLDEKAPYLLRSVRSANTPDGIVKTALKCREKLELSLFEPIYDICGLLEHCGVKVYSIVSASEGFFGLSIGEEDGGPAIVVNVNERIPVERRIFSAAHEVGHLVLHKSAFDVNKTEEDKQEEKEAHLFAGHFLMPDGGFVKEWKEAAGLPLIDRVFKVKRIFRVSYKAVLHRLIEHKAVDSSIWASFSAAYERRFGQKLAHREEPMAIETTEPFGMESYDFYEDRFSKLTRRAIDEGEISLGRGAELLRIPLLDMRELVRNWEVVR